MGAGRFTWRRLRVFIDGLKSCPESALWRQLDPDGARDELWTINTHRATDAVDLLTAANWQRSEDGSKGRNKPKPTPRPSDKHAADSKADLIQRSIAERKKRRTQRRG